MDRIAALRNIEDALSAFERGELDLQSAEEQIVGVIRTFATEYEDQRTTVYRVSDDEQSVVVVAPAPQDARDRAASLTAVDAARATVTELGRDR